MLSKKTIAITGGTGSLGQALVKRFYDNNHLIIVSKDVHKQAAMEARFPFCEYYLTDITEKENLYDAFVGADFVIHAAAAKHVSVGERAVREYIRVNIDGSQAVVDACKEAGISNVLLISTDKACEPINLYGKTKAIAEDIFRYENFYVLRYGNVVSSAGAFIHIWRKLIEQNKSIMVRNPPPTRFALPMSKAVDLVELTFSNSPGLFIPTGLKKFLVMEIARYLGAKIENEPLLRGEKQHEVLLAEDEWAFDMNNGLAIVFKGHSREETIDRHQFNSLLAEHMSAEELLEMVDSN